MLHHDVNMNTGWALRDLSSAQLRSDIKFNNPGLGVEMSSQSLPLSSSLSKFLCKAESQSRSVAKRGGQTLDFRFI